MKSLKQARRSVGATQADIARDADVNYHRIVYAETNRLELKPQEVRRIEKVLRKRVQVAKDAIA
jgi:DNA-binding XRE family transcriptional regulator